jgi:hypothetical protein
MKARDAAVAPLWYIVFVGFVIWVLIRRRQMPEAETRQLLAQAAGASREATCPVCLALRAENRLQIHLDVEHHHNH